MNEPSALTQHVVRCVKYVLLYLVLLAVVASALAPHVFLAWATAYPAADTRHDPHHWLSRLAALCVLLAYGQFFLREAGRAWGRFRAWQRVFLPWPRGREDGAG